MKLFYNGTGIHTIGAVSLSGEQTDYVPAEAPTKKVTRLTFRIDVWRQGYTDNRVLMSQVLDTLVIQQAQLKVTQEKLPNETSGAEHILYDQTAKIVSHNFPQDINEWGTNRQQVQLVFEVETHNLTSNLPSATFTPSGGSAISLPNIVGFKESFRSIRFDVKRDHRESVEGVVVLKGEILGDMSQSLTARRNAMMTTRDALAVALEKKTGLLVYGPDFSKNVRVQDQDFDTDSHVDKIPFNFTCTYTRFPNEAGYAVAEYDASTRTGEDGEVTLALSGSIQAESRARADAKLATIRTAVLATQGMSSSQQTRSDITEKSISSSSYNGPLPGGTVDTGDGDAFIEIRFSEEYHKRAATHLSWGLTISDQESTESGLIIRTYSGFVISGYTGGQAGLSDADKAYVLAANKAKDLGENKHPIRMSGDIKRDDRVTSSAATQEFIRVEFSFTYKVRGTRIYLEAKTDKDYQQFGDDSTTISGYACGASDADLETAYQTIRSAYNASIVRNERKTTGEIKMTTGNFANPLTTTLTPEAVFAFSGTGYNSLTHKMEFSFNVFVPKPAGAFSFKYAMQVQTSFTAMTKTTTVQGSMFGEAALITNALNAVANNKLELLLASLNLGTSIERNRAVDREHVGGVTSDPGLTQKLDFTEVFQAKLDGGDTILECEVNEDITFSGANNVVIKLPDRGPVVQQIGTTECRRVISGSVTAANETAALRWVRTQKTMPFRATVTDVTAPATPTAANRYYEPEQITSKHIFVPLTYGEARSGTAAKKARVVQVTFRFAEIIPDHFYTLGTAP